MKTKRKGPVLKWRKVKYSREYRAGPFSYVVYDDHTKAWVDTQFDIARVCSGTTEACKAACERFARAILRHCASGARHGKQ